METVKIDGSQATFTGLFFEILNNSGKDIKIDDYWKQTKQAMVEGIEERGGFPLVEVMPCGNYIRFESPRELLSLPIEDKPCPCGNPKHWLVQYVSY